MTQIHKVKTNTIFLAMGLKKGSGIQLGRQREVEQVLRALSRFDYWALDKARGTQKMLRMTSEVCILTSSAQK